MNYRFNDNHVATAVFSTWFIRYHIDIAYFATCCCVVGLALERYILICHYSEAKRLLSRSFRVKFLLLSLVLTALPIAVEVTEGFADEAWLSKVSYKTISDISKNQLNCSFQILPPVGSFRSSISCKTSQNLHMLCRMPVKGRGPTTQIKI